MLLPANSNRPAKRSFQICTFACAAWLAGIANLSAAAGDTPGAALTQRSFAPRSTPGGSTMFTEVPPEQSGIVATNHYADPKMWGERYHEFEVGAIGTGIAIGDYDGDGRPDIFVVSKTESCRLFRNLGGWKFEDVTERAGVADKGSSALIWKQGATFADVNNDGRLDLYVCRFDAPNLLYINQGDGTFKESAASYRLDVKDASVMATFADYDRDGWLDVFIQTNLLSYNQHPGGQSDYLFHNNRDGTFSNVTAAAGIAGEAQGHSATWWDFDADGWLDLYVANDFARRDQLYHNNRNGTFTDVLSDWVPHIPYSSMGADFGDVNNDGRIDFLVCDMAASSHEKDQRGMADSRGRTVEDSQTPHVAPQYERNALFIAGGGNRFMEAAFLAGMAATDWTWAPRFEDLDNDGRLDLFVTNGMHRESTNLDLLARQMAAETTAERLRILRDSPMLAEPNIALRNRGDLQFEDVGAAWGLNQRGVSFGSAFGDLDGDGDLDLIYANYQKNVTVLRNDTPQGHRIMIDLRGTLSNRFGIGATVRIESEHGPQIRQLITARGVLSSSEPAVHFGLGADVRIKKLTVTWPSGAIQSFADVAADQRLTITEPAGVMPSLDASEPAMSAGQFEEVSSGIGLSFESREDAIDETAQQRLLPRRLNRRGPGIAISDLNGDGWDDIAIGGTTVTPARILLATGQGGFVPVDTATMLTRGPVNDGPLALFDADGDGSTDLLVTKGGSSLPAGATEYQPRLWLNDGHGRFRAAPADTLPVLSISAGAVAVADWNRDDRLDIFIGARVNPGMYPTTPHSALLMNRGGRFDDVTVRLAPGLQEIGMVTAAIWSDVDGDGWPDLLLAVEWGSVRFFHNREGQGFEDWSERAGFAAAGTGWWTSLAAGDFNEDGRLDYAVGNVGLNTQYQASSSRPAMLFDGDFKGAGEEPQLVEAYYENDRLYPWRSRRDLAAAVPSIAKRFTRNNAYARATLDELLGTEKLAAATRYSASELRSGIFLSQPDGTFVFEPLPRIAQISPFQGMVAGDFDGDGHTDLYAVQNSFAPIPAVGRFDGGISQLFRGDGRGHFAPLSANETHLVVPGDAKALSVVDFDHDGRPDFVISRNNDLSLAFRNANAASRLFSVRLKQRGGNPTAIGARITVERADGSEPFQDVSAGTGCYSQSTPACFFGTSGSNPVKRIRVRWPSGQISEHTVSAGEMSVVLVKPVD